MHCLVRKYWDIDYKYSQDLGIFYITAKVRRNSSPTTFVPWPAVRNLTLNLISKIHSELKENE